MLLKMMPSPKDLELKDIQLSNFSLMVKTLNTLEEENPLISSLGAKRNLDLHQLSEHLLKKLKLSNHPTKLQLSFSEKLDPLNLKFMKM